jgi:glutamate 5-kinase
MRDSIKGTKRLVVKVGTSTLTYSNGHLNLQRIEHLVREMADLHNRGIEVLLVSSGAVRVGANRLGLKSIPRTLPDKQALAAIGQGALMQIYEKLFSEYNKTMAQVLLSRGDIDDRVRYLNATNALLALLDMQVIPVINENDTVAVEELRFGDNDTLSAMVAGLVTADLLIILSDVDGLYDRDPHQDKKAKLIEQIEEITPDMEKNSTNRGSSFASGGMFTKLTAARICMASGINMVIANSAEANVIRRIVAGETIGSYFVPREVKMHARDKWIAFGSVVHGKILIDAGASTALLKKGKSLLPSGVVGVVGEFERGAVVAVIDFENREIARGITNYSSAEIAKIQGKKTSEIEKILGEKDYDEIIHRNNLWVEH